MTPTWITSLALMSVPVPTQDRVRLHQQDSIAPVVDQAREQDNQTALVRLEGGTLDLAGGNNQLLTEQGVLGEEVVARPSEVRDQPGQKGGGLVASLTGRQSFRVAALTAARMRVQKPISTTAMCPVAAEPSRLVLARFLNDPGADERSSHGR